ncbi:hypothetical protein PInf_016374 [Phytophthora infestans]|nr:hypothetical protein PInf_016374 [Phytophthora infestans]
MGTFVPPPRTSRGFAYLTLQGTDAESQSEKLQKTFNRTKWRGSVLKVQLAKPHFQLKLQQEWEQEEHKKKQAEGSHREQQQQINTPTEELQPLKLAVKFKGRKKTRFPEVDEVVEQVEDVEPINKQVATDTETSEEENDDESEAEESELEEDVAAVESESEEDVGAEDVLGEDDVEAFVRQMEEENEMEESEQEKKPLMKEEANARRLAALETKRQQKKEEQVAIPPIGEAVGNKKITFDDSGNEQEPEELEEHDGVISNWMESSDDEAGDEGERGARKTFDFTEDADVKAQAAFALRPEFVGEKGKKLFEMQKRFGGDSRFRLDARFLEGEGADEYGGNEVDEEEQAIDEEAITELQNFLDEENVEEAARHAREMREEEEAALRVVSKLFPDVDVTRLQRRMQERRTPKDPLKEAAWMGELKRYDPRDTHACREFEIPMTTTSSGVQTEEEATAPLKREEKEIVTGGDRFFSTAGDLSNLFSRVRKNSEDGEEGEAALDGVFGFGAPATETNAEASFKLSSLFSFPVGEDKPLAAMGEQLLEDEQEEPASRTGDWAFSQEDHDDEAMATDSEAGDDIEDEGEIKAELAKKRAKKSLEDFLVFGKTFVSGEEVADWPERRKKLTLDYKRKRRDAVKMKKRQNKQQNKVNKAKTDTSGTSSKWKKRRI